MYHYRFWAWAIALFFVAHLMFGYLHCASNFCPGDSEAEWVYEEKINGQWYVRYNDRYYTREEYKKLVSLEESK